MPPDASGFTITDTPTETLDEAVTRLAAKSPLAYEQMRIEEAKHLNVRAPALDQAVAAARREAATGAATGRAMVLDDPALWETPVTTSALLDELAAAIQRHMVLPKAAAVAVALWIMHTWVAERFDHTPRLGITSPTKRCGKSTLLDILRTVCRRALKADNISASGIFRTVEALAPLTLLIDEADSFLTDNEELRGVLNSGFERSGAVIRVVETGGEHQPVKFSTFAPCALAAIGNLPTTLEDRAIPIRLERKAAAEQVMKLRDGRSRADLADIGRKLARWAADHSGDLHINPVIPSEMGDRQGDICVALLAIADHAGPAWSSRAREALLILFGAAAGAEAGAEGGVLLLGDVRTIFTETGSYRIPSTELCNRLAKMETRPWPEWKAGKPMTPVQLARALKPFGIGPATYRPPGGEPVKGYPRDQFEGVWQRYLPPFDAPPAVQRLHRNDAGKTYDSYKSDEVTRGLVLPVENAKKPRNEAACNRVTDQSAPAGAIECEGYL